MINDKSYIHIGWRMINELKLKWNALYVYAVIYSFTNGTDDHYFSWSLSYLSEWTNASKSTIQRTLKELLNKWLISKVDNYENWVKFVKYSTVNNGYSQNDYSIVKMNTTYSQNEHRGIVKMNTNYTSIYNNNIQDNKLLFNNNSEAETYWNQDINNLIWDIKEECNRLWVAYEKKDERKFAKHILTAKEYWGFAEKIWQNRKQFALNVLKASVQIWFFKWICAWPKSIYQHYAEVYNEFVKKRPKPKAIVLDDL